MPKALVFYHIPKCAGTSLRKILQKNFEENFLNLMRVTGWIGLHENLSKFSGQDICLAGHYAWGVEELIHGGWNVHKITIIRNPLSRFISHVGYKRLVGESGRDFSKKEIIQYANLYTELLGGGDLERAKEALEKEFAFVGLQEEYNISIKYLAKKYNFRYVDFQKLKVSKKQDDLHLLDRDFFSECNRKDLELYEFALELFKKKTRNIMTPVAQFSLADSQQGIVMNAAHENLKDIAQMPLPEIVKWVYEYNARKGSVQQIVRYLENMKRNKDALELFSRFHAVTYFPETRLHLLEKADSTELIPFLIDVVAGFKGIPSNYSTSDVNKVRKKLLDCLLDAVFVQSNRPVNILTSLVYFDTGIRFFKQVCSNNIKLFMPPALKKKYKLLELDGNFSEAYDQLVDSVKAQYLKKNMSKENESGYLSYWSTLSPSLDGMR